MKQYSAAEAGGLLKRRALLITLVILHGMEVGNEALYKNVDPRDCYGNGAIPDQHISEV